MKIKINKLKIKILFNIMKQKILIFNKINNNKMNNSNNRNIWKNLTKIMQKR